MVSHTKPRQEHRYIGHIYILELDILDNQCSNYICPRKRSASDDQAPDRREMSTGGHQKMERRQDASCSPIQVQHFDCIESLEKS